MLDVIITEALPPLSASDMGPLCFRLSCGHVYQPSDAVVRIGDEVTCGREHDRRQRLENVVTIATRLLQTEAKPTYNHTRGDSARTPCPTCADQQLNAHVATAAKESLREVFREELDRDSVASEKVSEAIRADQDARIRRVVHEEFNQAFPVMQRVVRDELGQFTLLRQAGETALQTSAPPSRRYTLTYLVPPTNPDADTYGYRYAQEGIVTDGHWRPIPRHAWFRHVETLEAFDASEAQARLEHRLRAEGYRMKGSPHIVVYELLDIAPA